MPPPERQPGPRRPRPPAAAPDPAPRPYSIVIDRRASKALESLPSKIQLQIEKRIDALAADPRPFGVEKLKGHESYRVRSGDYRIVYDIRDRQRLVLILRVGDRKEVYDRL